MNVNCTIVCILWKQLCRKATNACIQEGNTQTVGQPQHKREVHGEQQARAAHLLLVPCGRLSAAGTLGGQQVDKHFG